MVKGINPWESSIGFVSAFMGAVEIHGEGSEPTHYEVTARWMTLVH